MVKGEWQPVRPGWAIRSVARIRTPPARERDPSTSIHYECQHQRKRCQIPVVAMETSGWGAGGEPGAAPHVAAPHEARTALEEPELPLPAPRPTEPATACEGAAIGGRTRTRPEPAPHPPAAILV
ncbi:MAG: hypothetical protein Kow0054_26950 [Deferrisoma sp.]